MFPPLCLMELNENQQQQKPAESQDPQNVEFVSFFGELFSDVFGGS